MIVLLLLALGTALIAICAYAYWAKRREETPEDLRGDWWSKFEAEFREYARRCDATGATQHSPRQSRVRRERPPQRRDLAEGSF